jgi:hypothetical protein
MSAVSYDRVPRPRFEPHRPPTTPSDPHSSHCTGDNHNICRRRKLPTRSVPPPTSATPCVVVGCGHTGRHHGGSARRRWRRAIARGGAVASVERRNRAGQIGSPTQQVDPAGRATVLGEARRWWLPGPTAGGGFSVGVLCSHDSGRQDNVHVCSGEDKGLAAVGRQDNVHVCSGEYVTMLGWAATYHQW